MNWFFPPTTALLERTFLIRGARTGTAFVIENDDRQYIVTAAHLLAASSSPAFYVNGGWRDLGAELLAISQEDDVAVLTLRKYIGGNNLMFAGDLMLGQPLFFLGFPFGEAPHIPLVCNGNRPVPLVKWASVSMFPGAEYHGDVLPDLKRRLVLQGTANDGFSGGPVFGSTRDGKHFMCGMVIKSREEGRLIQRFDGAPLEESLEYKLSTEFTIACATRSIKEVIGINPQGVPVRGSR